MSNQDKKPVKSQKSRLPLIISLLMAGSIVVSYFVFPEVQSFCNEAWNVLTSDDEERIESWVSGFGWMGPVVLVLSMIAQMFLLVIPSVLLMVVSILAYGPVWGSLIIFISIFAASSVGYAIGSYFGSSLVNRIIGKKSEQKIADFLEDYGFWAVFVTRLNPFLSNDAISFVGGLLRMGYWKFIGSTLVGITPLTLFIAYFGGSTEGLKTGLLWGSLVSLALFGLYVWWDKKWRNKKK